MNTWFILVLWGWLVGLSTVLPWALVGLVCVVVALAWMGLQAAYRAAVRVLARNRDLRPSDLRGSGGHVEFGSKLSPLGSIYGAPAGEEATLNNARCALHDVEFAVHSKLAAGAAMAHDPAAVKPTEPAMSHEAALLRELWGDPEKSPAPWAGKAQGWRGTGGARNAETGPEAAWSRP